MVNIIIFRMYGEFKNEKKKGKNILDEVLNPGFWNNLCSNQVNPRQIWGHVLAYLRKEKLLLTNNNQYLKLKLTRGEMPNLEPVRELISAP